MSNTIKLSSKQGEIFIGQQEHKRYKNLELFGYGYIDWGRVVNQSLVTLYDLIDSIESNGVSDITFDLKEYEEAQKVLRSEEFKTWKQEYKNILTTEIESYSQSVDKMLTEFDKTINGIKTSTSEIIEENYGQLSKEISGVYSQVEKTIDTQIQLNIKSLVEKINNTNQAVQDATQKLTTSTNNINSVVQEVENTISKFKEGFEQSFIAFKKEVENTLVSYKSVLTKYIDDKFVGLAANSSELGTKVGELENKLNNANLSGLEERITTNVNSTFTSKINEKYSATEKAIEVLASNISNVNTTLTKSLSDGISEVSTKYEENFKQFANNINLVKKELEDLKKTGESSQVEIGTFFLETRKIMDSPASFAEDLYYTKALNINNNISENINIRMLKLMEQIVLQNEINIKNVKEYIDSERTLFLNSLRDTGFDELALISNRTSEKKLIENRHALKVESLDSTKFTINDFMVLGSGEKFVPDNGKVSFIVLNLNIPKDVFPEVYDGAELRISIDNKKPNGKDRAYYRTVLINVPRISAVLEKKGVFLKSNVYPNIPTGMVIDDFIDSEFLGDEWYSFNNSSPILLNISKEEFSGEYFEEANIAVSIIGKNKTYNLSFKPKELYDNTKSSFIYNIIENKTNYSKDIQDIINNNIIPNYTFSRTPLSEEYQISLPVCELQSQIKNSIETKTFRIKINLPKGATLTSLNYKIGAGAETVKPFGNVTYNMDYTKYLENKTSNAGKDLYFTDLQTTGIVKIPVPNSTTTITGSINYVLGNVSKMYTFTV